MKVSPFKDQQPNLGRSKAIFVSFSPNPKPFRSCKDRENTHTGNLNIGKAVYKTFKQEVAGPSKTNYLTSIAH